jgi:hypothetical protein
MTATADSFTATVEGVSHWGEALHPVANRTIAAQVVSTRIIRI